MGSPLISVVLPVYNGARYIEESIRSIIDQTHSNWELIIYDAASTDGTPQVLESIWNKYPILKSRGKIIRSEIKHNVPLSLNLGFQQAKGDFFTWTSDDNLYLPEAFEKMLGALHSHSEASLVYAHSYKIDSTGKRTGVLRSLPREHLVYGNNIGLCFLYRREVAEQINGYDVNRFLVEDYDFWMRASEHFKFVHLDEVLYEIRYHGESLTENNYRKMSYLAEDVFERDFPKMMRWLPKEWKIRGHLRLVKTGLKQKKWGRAFRHAAQGVATSPSIMLKEAALKLSRAFSNKKAKQDV